MLHFMRKEDVMRNFSKLAILVSHEESDDALYSGPSVKMSNGTNSVQCSDFKSALNMLPPGSAVTVIANGTVGNKAVHYLSRIIREGSVFVSLDLSDVTEFSRVLESPFAGNKNLLEIRFPKNLVAISSRGFADCENLSYVNIPASCKKIGVQAFAGCEKLEELVFSDFDGWQAVTEERVASPVCDLENAAQNPSKFALRNGDYYGCMLQKNG